MNNIVDGRKVSLCSMLFILSSKATVLKQIMGTHVHTKNRMNRNRNSYVGKSSSIIARQER